MNEKVVATSSVLEQIERFYNIAEIAKECSVNPSTVHRWLNRTSRDKEHLCRTYV